MSVAETEPRATSTAGISYVDLYRRWEENNWSAMGIDFSRDRAGWDSLTETQRTSALWMYSMFFYGEDSVADNLSPYIDAAPTEGMKHISRDEQRHIGFGVKLLSEIVPQSEECKAAVVELFREVDRYSLGVFCPPVSTASTPSAGDSRSKRSPPSVSG